MNRKIWAVSCLGISLALHIHMVITGLIDASFLWFPIRVCWGGFVLPVGVMVVLVERVYGLEPFAGGHRALTWIIMLVGASGFWLLAFPNFQRLLGIYDAFGEGKRRWPSLSRFGAAILDKLQRLNLGKGNNAEWAGIINGLATRWRPGDFFVGRWALWGQIGTLRPSGIAPTGLGITIAGSGAGKSTAVCIPNIALHQGPGIFFDVKGELARACAARRRAGGNGIRGLHQDTYTFDPLGISGLDAARYNPLYEAAMETCLDFALCLLMKMAEGLLKTPDGGSGENSWVTSGGRQVAYGLACYLLAAYPPEKQNLVELRRLLREGEIALQAAIEAGEKGKRGRTPFDELLWRMKHDVEGRFAEVSAAEAANIEKMGDRQLGSIFGALVEATSWLDLPMFKHAVTGCDFLLRDFMTERISVFVCLPINELVGFAGGIARVILNMFLHTLFQLNPFCKPLPHGYALCVVDEFCQFSAIPAFTKISTTMRDYQLKCLIFLQDKTMLEDTYGTMAASTFLGGVAYIQVMAIKHLETLKWLVEALGERQVRERQPDGRTTMRVYPLLDVQQASNYLAARAGNQIVLRGDAPPLRLKVAHYWSFLPFWMYSPDPRHPEPWLRRKMRARAVRKAAEAEAKAKVMANKKASLHAARA